MLPEETLTPLPPELDTRKLNRIPRRHRGDALQEAWLAHLSGHRPTAAAGAYACREARLERRFDPWDADRCDPARGVRRKW